MKKYLLLLAGLAMTSALSAKAFQVSTEPQTKAVLLETHVGMYCPYCAEGHQVAKELKWAMGSDLNIMANHTGRLSIPQGSDPNYRSDAGQQVAALLGGASNSFPNGAINRVNWNGDQQYVFSRSNWASRAKQASAQMAPLNLYAEATYEAATRELSVHVEGYVTANEIEAGQKLHVFLTENNVLGLQNTAAGYDESYFHQHMLRDAITDPLGNTLTECVPHDYFIEDYIYTVPDSYKNVVVNDEELEVVVFVTDASGYNVKNSVSVKPEYVGELALNASIEEQKIGVTNNYQFDFVELALINRCNTPITSAQFKVCLNDASEEIPWTGNLAAFATQTIQLPVNWKGGKEGFNHYEVYLTQLNGEAVAALPIKGSFTAAPKIVTPQELVMNICTPYEYPEDYTYTLYKADGSVDQTFGPYTDNVMVNENLSLEAGTTYCMEIASKWGNGLMPTQKALQLLDADGNVYAEIDTYKGFGARIFFTTQGEGTPVEEVLQDAETSNGLIYDLSGRLVKEPVRGQIYIQNGKKFLAE